MKARAANFEKRLFEWIEPQYRSATPSLRLQVHQHGACIADLGFGDVAEYYDWASLTKIVFSATAVMRLSLKYPDLLGTDLSKILPGFRQPSGARDIPLEAPWVAGQRPLVTLQRLLTHSAGFVWWKAFYSEIEAARVQLDEGLRPGFSPWRQLRKLVLQEEPNFQGKAVYSDVDFFLVGFALEEIVGRPLAAIWKELAQQIGLEDVHFCAGNRPARDVTRYAPTENVPERGGVLQGRVHDENTFAVGGVAAHAGLFGRIEDLSRFGLMLRACLNDEIQRVWELDRYVVDHFTGRRLPETVGDWGLGFMKPTAGSSSCGPLFSSHSFGHTGFTGTSLWFDPDRDLLVTMLSNRVNPTRENKLWIQMRPQIHSQIVYFLDS